MTKKNIENQEINNQEKINNDVDTTTAETTSSDNMAEQSEEQTDNVAEKIAEEQIDWKDQYIRLQAEFDNFRKRTIREKMDLIQSGGSDVLKAILPILDDMQRAIAASEKSDDIAALREGERLVVRSLSTHCVRRRLSRLRLSTPHLTRTCTKLLPVLQPVRIRRVL